jgi:hypothetical protein
VALVQVFNREHFGIAFAFEDYYKTDGDTSFGGDVLYRHAWNSAGRFRLQVSLRERPTLPVVARAMQAQSYFSHLEFPAFTVRALQPIEMIAETMRAAFQRVKVRDLYDLYRFAATRFDGELLRGLVALKLWQVRDPFDPDAFFTKLRAGTYDWDDLRRNPMSGSQITALSRSAPGHNSDQPSRGGTSRLVLLAVAQAARSRPPCEAPRRSRRGPSAGFCVPDSRPVAGPAFAERRAGD